MFRCGALRLFVPVLAGFVLLSTGCATAPAAAPVAARGQPDWVANLSAYRASRPTHVVAVGHGRNRQAAETDALRQLVVTFGVDVQVDQRIVETYRGVEGGRGTHHAAVDSEIALIAGMNLIGAEIGDVWTNSRGGHYALAVLNRERAARMYTDMINENLRIIGELTDMTPAQRNTFDGFARYRLAAVIADMNVSYGEVLAVIGAPVTGLRRGDDFMRVTQEIAAAVPVGITVSGDRANRIQGAFARAFADQGFRTGAAGSRYLLNVNVVVLPTEHAGANVFARMELSADLTDTATGAVLLPFNFNLREGHRSQSEAENRVFLVAEQRIARYYGDMLEDYLSMLVRGR